jgi:hypothetical protein
MELKDWITLLGVLAGLFLWRVQLIGKRRTEVAEEALMAFRLAADALEYIRSPAVYRHETEEALKSIGLEPPPDEFGKDPPGTTFLIPLWRIQEHRDKFTPLRKMELLSRYHFGGKAEAAFQDLAAARNEVRIAAQIGYQMQRQDPHDYRSPDLMKFQAKIWAMGKDDPIAAKVAKAQADLETELGPTLRNDAALLPVAAGWARCKAWTKEKIWGKPAT